MVFWAISFQAFDSGGAEPYKNLPGKSNPGVKNPSKRPMPPNQISHPNNPFVLGPEDYISISVWGSEELTVEMPVRPDGKISFPLIGDILANGLTPAQLKDTISKKLRKYISDANVTVIVKTINSINISVAGQVREPGTYKINRPVTLMHLFSMAKGFTEKADLRKSYLLRGGKKVKSNIYALVKEDDFTQNVWLQPNDFVFIHDNSINISVAGQVREPGTYKINRPVTLMHLFSMAKGFTEKADLKKSYLLRNGKKVKLNIYALVREDDFTQNVWLKPDDFVFIHDNFESRINITGEVKKPQVITYQEGMTVMDVVLMADGLTDIAKAKGTKVYRKYSEKSSVSGIEKINVELDKVIFEGDLSKNILLRPGDIIHIPKSFF